MLVDNNIFNIVAVILRNKPDFKIKDLCDELSILAINPNDINELDYQAIPNAEFGISVSYDQIFKEKTIAKYKKGMINLHASSLPNYKGRNVLNWALINGEKKIHLTVHWIDAGIDTGPIIHQQEITIQENETYASLLEKCHKISPKALSDALTKIDSQDFSPIIQDSTNSLPRLCSKRKEGDEVIDWGWNSKRIHNFVRALCLDGLYASTYLYGEEIKIKKTEYLPAAPIYIDICGSILKKESDSFIVKTGDSYIRVIEWEAVSKVKLGSRFTNKWQS